MLPDELRIILMPCQRSVALKVKALQIDPNLSGHMSLNSDRGMMAHSRNSAQSNRLVHYV